jgi:competence protein ComEC
VRVPERLSLGWYRGFDDDSLLAGPAEPLRAGQRWRFTLRLRQPHGAMNPHGFDLELWMFERGLGASGYVRARPESPPEKLTDQAGAPVQRARQALRDALQHQVGEGAAADVLAALLFGDQAAIAREDWEVFRLTGVAHLMSISGLHVTMFAWLAGAAIAWLWRRSARAPLWLPAPQAARWGGLACAAAYALLAGWGVPAQRTVGMIAVVVLLRTAGARWPLHAVLLAVALAVALGDPWALLQPGFWLSFVAVALLVASEPLQGGPAEPAPAAGWHRAAFKALRGGLRTQAVATVGLAPLTLVFFQQLSLVGFAANLVAIPLVTLLVVPLAMAGVLLPPLWSLAAALVQGLMAMLEALAAWPWAPASAKCRSTPT